MEDGERAWSERGDTEERSRWAAVLGIVLVMMVVITVVPESAGVLLVGGLLVVLVAVIVYRSPVVPRGLRTANLVAVAPAVALSVVDVVTAGDGTVGWRNLAVVGVLGTATLALLHRIAHHRVITMATAFGAVDAYVLLGLTFAAVYAAVEAFTGELFAGGEPTGFETMYFSFITLTTVGYGDLTPASDLARSLAVVQALLGQVFLVVLVARTVSLIGQSRETPGAPG